VKNHIDICEIRFQTISGANPRKSIFGELAPSKFKTTIGHLNDRTLRWQVQHEKNTFFQNCDGRLFAAIRKGKKQNKPLKKQKHSKIELCCDCSDLQWRNQKCSPSQKKISRNLQISRKT
jgi:hypothetical protein